MAMRCGSARRCRRPPRRNLAGLPTPEGPPAPVQPCCPPFLWLLRIPRCVGGDVGRSPFTPRTPPTARSGERSEAFICYTRHAECRSNRTNESGRRVVVRHQWAREDSRPYSTPSSAGGGLTRSPATYWSAMAPARPGTYTHTTDRVCQESRWLPAWSRSRASIVARSCCR